MQAVRYLNHMELATWRKSYPNLYDRVINGPLLVETAEAPLTRLVENLQVELQMRSAELLLAMHDEQNAKETTARS